MKHALVIGGTGMLAKTSLWLIDNGYRISVLARDRIKMNSLIEQAEEGQITPLLVDYANDKRLREAIQGAIEQNGKVDLVIAWIHSHAKKALDTARKEVSQTCEPWRLIHVLGSSSNLEEIYSNMDVPENCVYQQVQLGFIVEGNRSRWLTHNEISSGVIDAIKKDQAINIVGVLEPWEMRP